MVELTKLTLLETLRYMQESPEMEVYHTHDNMSKNLKAHREYLEKLSKEGKTTKLGNSRHYYKESDGRHHYFHMKDGRAKEYLHVDHNNITQIAHKEKDGDVSHIRHAMTHHVHTHGELKTYHNSSVGGKSLWVNYVKSKPKGVKFEMHDEHGVTPIDHKTIDSHDAHLWGKGREFQKRIIKAVKADNT